jgi:tetratricopeptide (TPR) repeat protein
VFVLFAIAAVPHAQTQTPAPSQTQTRWTWPEKPKNLKVLTGFNGERLRPVMTGFTRALGVRCSHCHVGEEGAPLTTYDFASDEKPAKDTAREMLRMLESVNGHLKKIEPSSTPRVNMWCHTCHRGRPRPMQLGEELSGVFHAQGADSMVARYASLRERFFARGAYDFGEGSLNELGYELLGAGDAAAALRVFRLNVEAYPQSANVYDSLAEALEQSGDRDEAIANYRKSLELDPKNEHAAEKLAELEGSTKSEP